jgi:hypothetical protein
VQAWLRPDLLNFPCAPRAEYIHWLGKGDAGAFEWGFRFYKKDSSRPNRLSAYIWNSNGGEGAGAHFEEPIVPGRWIDVVAVYQHPSSNAGVAIYRDGVLKNGPPSSPTLLPLLPRHAPTRRSAAAARLSGSHEFLARRTRRGGDLSALSHSRRDSEKLPPRDLDRQLAVTKLL